MADIINKLFRLALALAVVFSATLLVCMPALAASTESSYDENGYNADEKSRLQALDRSGDSSEADRQSGDVWGLDRGADETERQYFDDVRSKLQESEDGESSQRSTQDAVLGESEKYADVDANRLFSSEGQNDYGILTAGSSVLNIIVNGVLLPAAILVVSWETIYLAIFPILAGIDPLGKVSGQGGGGGGRGGGRGRGGGGAAGIRTAGQEEIKKKVKNLLIGVFIVFTVWFIIRILIMVAIMLIGVF